MRSGLKPRLRVEQSLMIAPLLDIMFLVLLFFILNTSTGNVESFDVDIPKAEVAENRSPPDQLVVIIRADSQNYSINDQSISDSDFERVMAERMQTLRTYQVLLLASEAVDYGRVMTSMDRLKRAGATSVSLGVERID
jgi:biopolymer transport protein ExbD